MIENKNEHQDKIKISFATIICQFSILVLVSHYCLRYYNIVVCSIFWCIQWICI